MTKYVEWVEPYCFFHDPEDSSFAQIVRVTVEDAISIQYKTLEKSGNTVFKYESDQQALDDFVTVHWAKIVEES